MLKLSSFYVAVHSTFGGNPLASAVAIASLEVIKEEKLAERYQMHCEILYSQHTLVIIQSLIEITSTTSVF